jgi:hypothetical protein
VVSDFTLSELARLLPLLTNDPKVRSEIAWSQLNLSRGQLYHGLTRDAFLPTTVAPSFNLEIRPVLDTRGQVEEADAAVAPLQNRGGDVLNAQFFGVKAHFTEAYRTWDLSRHLQSEAASFLPKHRGSASELTMEGKRLMIVLVALKCGTPFEVVDMLNMTSKMAIENRRYDCSAGREGDEEFQDCLRPAKRLATLHDNDATQGFGLYVVAGCDSLALSIRDAPLRESAVMALLARTKKAADAALALYVVNQRSITRDALKRLKADLQEELAKSVPDEFDIDQYHREIQVLQRVL